MWAITISTGRPVWAKDSVLVHVLNNKVVTAHIVMAHIVMAHMVMAYTVVALSSYGNNGSVLVPILSRKVGEGQ